MLRPVRSGTWPGLLLAASLCLGIGQARAASGLVWPEALYNPQPRADDLILPLPCGGAMAFRAVATPGREAGYAVTGPFEGANGTPYLLLGKYEVTGLQAQALASAVAGAACPTPEASLQTPQIGDWWDALQVADRYSLWLAANAESIAACDAGAAPCLPRVDGAPAYLRLPTEAEWEYAVRGGLRVAAGTFAGPLYPMPDGLTAHAWYAPNARGALQPIGGRAASPQGLHDLYGNAAEWVLGPSGPGALAVGGHAGSPAQDLGAEWRWATPPVAADPGAPTGLRLLAGVPLFTTPEKVRDAQRRRLAPPAPVAQIPPPPPPVRFLGYLRVTTDVTTEVLVDGQVIGQAKPGQPFETQAIAVGERPVAFRSAGYQTAPQVQRFRTGQWVEATVRLSDMVPPKPGVASSPWPTRDRAAQPR